MISKFMRDCLESARKKRNDKYKRFHAICKKIRLQNETRMALRIRGSNV